jgi:Family of unknown function (DUF6522)
MGMIEFEESAIQVDATIVGEGLGIEPSLLQAHMREGKVTSMCERGVDEDIGRHRLTFFYGSRRFRLIIDEAGSPTLLDQLLRSSSCGVGAQAERLTVAPGNEHGSSNPRIKCLGPWCSSGFRCRETSEWLRIAHCAGQTGQPRPANLHLIEVDDGREAGAGMMIIEKMLPRALGRKLAVVSIERNLDSLGAELELEKMIAV